MCMDQFRAMFCVESFAVVQWTGEPYIALSEAFTGAPTPKFDRFRQSQTFKIRI